VIEKMTNEAALKKMGDEGTEGAAALDIKALVRQYVQETFFLGAAPNRLTDTMPLITGGIIDSIGMIGLVAFLEEQFKIALPSSEINAQGLDTLDRIEALVRQKLESRP
jgi:acyl carrier protein